MSSDGAPASDQPAPWIKDPHFKYVADPLAHLQKAGNGASKG